MSESGDNGDNKSGQRRALSDEDADLWARVADSADPLSEDKKNFVRTVNLADQPPRPKKPVNPGKTSKTLKETESNNSARSKTKTDTGAAPPLAKFDHKKARKIAKGQDDIDARIDLHGMRQAEAHSALRTFLFKCQSNEKRNVLVITGKGSTKRRSDDDNMAWFDYDEPGVLKRMLPSWLAEPDLRAIVVSYTEAHTRHGGSGAYYVRLRKPGK